MTRKARLHSDALRLKGLPLLNEGVWGTGSIPPLITHNGIGCWWLIRIPPPPRRATVEVLEPASTRVTELTQSQSHIETDGQSVSQSVLVSSPMWGSWPDIYYCLTSESCLCGAPSLMRRWVCLLSESLSAVISHLSCCKRYLKCYTSCMVIHVYTIRTGPLSVQAQHSRSFPYF
jgi:hypothetical protein